MKKTSLPWLVLVPDTDRTEIFELSTDEQQQLLDNISKLSAFMKQTYTIDKLNVASIGNVVSQLHVHIIGRRKDDFCWPGVAWGVPDNQPNHNIKPATINKALEDWFEDNFQVAP